MKVKEKKQRKMMKRTEQKDEAQSTRSIIYNEKRIKTLFFLPWYNDVTLEIFIVEQKSQRQRDEIRENEK